MPKLPVVSGREATKAFSKIGWYAHRQVGSHLVMRKEGSKITLSIPQHSQAAGLTVEEFCELL